MTFRHDVYEKPATAIVAAINSVGHEQVKVHIEVERTAESLYQDHGAGNVARPRQAAFVYQMA